jgi:hypothetical protein
MAAAQAQDYADAVTGWADHLRSGGTTTWPDWLAQGPPEPGSTTPLHPLPDAVHLELVRRINLAGTGQPTAGLADRVLATASPGRGLVDVPLPWPGTPRHFGTPAIAPDRLPEDELIRLATGVIVHLLPGLPLPAPGSHHAGWKPPWRRRFRLHGSPGTVAAIRHGLVGQGFVESDWRPTHVVIARPVEVMMAEHWAANARAGGILKWSTLWRRAEIAGRLPEPIDVGAIAHGLEGRRREPLHVVVARDVQAAAEETARVLRARPFVVEGSGDLAQTDLMRRVNRLTAVVDGPALVRDRALRLATVLDSLPASPTPGESSNPFVPRSARAWARDQADATVRRLRDAGYAVHGDPDELAPAGHRHSGTVDRTRTLELAIAACLRTWRLQGGTP